MKNTLGKVSIVSLVVILGWVGLGESNAQSALRVPTEEVGTGVYRFSGPLWNEYALGSATVVRHPKIAASAAHVVYDDWAFSRGAAWVGTNFFLANHHSIEDPEASSQKKTLRGYWNFNSYGGTASERDFNADIVAHYAYEDLAGGGFAGWAANNSVTRHPLNLAYPKILVGYPSTDTYFMTQTGPFTSRFRRSYGRHFWNAEASVISGMSGGGAFFQHPTSGEYLLGGVIVSGDPTDGDPGAGVRALDSNASRLMAYAIQTASRTTAVTNTFAHGTPVPIPDMTRAWTVVRIPVAGLPRRIDEVKLSLSITHSWIGDLEVVLRSPSRRTRSLHARQGRDEGNLQLEDVTVSTSFRGTAANGNWDLLVRDLASSDVGQVESIELTITGR